MAVEHCCSCPALAGRVSATTMSRSTQSPRGWAGSPRCCPLRMPWMGGWRRRRSSCLWPTWPTGQGGPTYMSTAPSLAHTCTSAAGKRVAHSTHLVMLPLPTSFHSLRLLELSREDRAAHIITQALRKYVWEKKYGKCTAHSALDIYAQQDSLLVPAISSHGRSVPLCVQAQC
jgi:hypothetical protein